MRTHPRIPSSLAALALLVAGIVSGDASGASSVSAASVTEWLLCPSVTGAAAVVLSMAALLPDRHGRMAVPAVLASVFFLGIFLARNNGTVAGAVPSDAPVPPVLSDFMAGKRAELSAVYAREGLSGDEYSVVSAMTLGDRQHISGTLREDYIVSGASHVFALSGLHLGMIYIILSLLLPRRRFPKSALSALLLLMWAYVALVGGRPSVVRAAVMLSLYSLLTLSGRHSGGLESLSATAFLLLVLRPSWLFDVGFQMSFMAVLSIVVFHKPHVRLAGLRPRRDGLFRPTPSEPSPPFGKETVRRRTGDAVVMFAGWVWSVFVLSLSANMGVMLLAAHYFGRFATYSVFSSFIVSPCSFAIIFLSFALLLSGVLLPVLPFLAPFTSLCASLLTIVVRFQNQCIGWIASLPGA